MLMPQMWLSLDEIVYCLGFYVLGCFAYVCVPCVSLVPMESEKASYPFVLGYHVGSRH